MREKTMKWANTASSAVHVCHARSPPSTMDCSIKSQRIDQVYKVSPKERKMSLEQVFIRKWRRSPFKFLSQGNTVEART